MNLLFAMMEERPVLRTLRQIEFDFTYPFLELQRSGFHSYEHGSLVPSLRDAFR